MKLLIEDDEGQKTAVAFSSDEITVGRLQTENTVHLAERNVSRRHARFTLVNGGVFVEDLGSSNGTRVNGERLQGRRKLRTGDLIQIGDYDLAVNDGAEELERPSTANAPAQAAPHSAPAPAPAAVARAPSTAMPSAAPAPVAPRPTGVGAPTEPAFPAMTAPAPAPSRTADVTQSDRMTKADRLIQSDRLTQSDRTAAGIPPAKTAPEASHRTESRPGIRPAPVAPASSAGWALPISRNRLVVAAVTVFVAFAALGFVVGRVHASPAPVRAGAPSTTR
jgi:predicted component of type VI protein secretion system